MRNAEVRIYFTREQVIKELNLFRNNAIPAVEGDLPDVEFRAEFLDESLQSQDRATRAAIATVFMKFIQSILK
jgi:hypothetical protein